jgi:NADPH:quinone reductase-like Zn-dependent oxidoreductase
MLLQPTTAVQMAKLRGARVLTTVSTDEKAAVAKAAGADEVILYTQVDFQESVMKLTDGKGVHCVYDGVGKATWEKSLKSLVRLSRSQMFVPSDMHTNTPRRFSLFSQRARETHTRSALQYINTPTAAAGPPRAVRQQQRRRAARRSASAVGAGLSEVRFFVLLWCTRVIAYLLLFAEFSYFLLCFCSSPLRCWRRAQ